MKRSLIHNRGGIYPRLLVLMMLLLSWHLTQAQIGISTPLFTGPDSYIVNNSSSFQAQAHIPLKFHIKKKDSVKAYIAVQPGLKLAWYFFRNSLVAQKMNGYTTFVFDEDPSHVYKPNKFWRHKSQMQLIWFNMPINYVFQIKGVKHLQFAPGVYMSYLLGGKFKRHYDVNGWPKNVKDKFKNDPDFYNFQRFQYGATANISYRAFTLFGSYALTPLFISGKGINIREYVIGLEFNIFKHVK